jgi:hypothetical protein
MDHISFRLDASNVVGHLFEEKFVHAHSRTSFRNIMNFKRGLKLQRLQKLRTSSKGLLITTALVRSTKSRRNTGPVESKKNRVCPPPPPLQQYPAGLDTRCVVFNTMSPEFRSLREQQKQNFGRRHPCGQVWYLLLTYYFHPHVIPRRHNTI